MAKGGAGITREPQAFTHRSLETLKPEKAPYRIPDSRCAGLAVRVSISGERTFDLAFRIRGVGPRRLSLGRFPDVALDAARDRANDLTKAGRAGVDLIADEEAAEAEKAAAAAAEAKRLTLAGLIENYAKRELRGKLRTAREIEARLKRALSDKLETPAEEIRRRDLRDLFDAVADAGFTREAEKRRQTVGAMFRWAVARDDVPVDPTAGLQAYDPGKPRDRVLSEDEIRLLWAWLSSDDLPPVHADVLRFQLLVGARCGEATGMDAAEIDTATCTWTLPPARSKNGKARATPLVGIAREIVERRLPLQGPVFPSEAGTPLRSSLVGQVLNHRTDRLPIAHFTTHDLRRTFATALDTMGISLDLIAAIVGHEATGNRETRTLVRHYVHSNKLDRKRVALEAWDARLREIVAGKNPKANVVPLSRPA